MIRKKKDRSAERRLRASYITSVISISLVLFVLGLLCLIILHTKKLSDYVKENIGFSIIIKENVREADIIQIQKTLDAACYVKSTEYITKEKAARELKEELGEDFISFIGYNPLLPSIDIQLKADYANTDSLMVIEKNILKNPNVKEVFYQKSLINLVNENVKKISLFLLFFSILLLLISIVLINNTIRLSVYSKRFLIKSMQLVGATQAFIRKPFIIKGVIQGIISSFIAIAMLIEVLYLVQREIPEFVNFQNIDIILIVFATVIVLGFIISWLSNYFAVRKFLRIKTDSLYY